MSKLSTAQVFAAEKYSHDGEFVEPLVRCDSCSELIFTKQLSSLGMCECGNKRVRNVVTLRSKELKKAREWVEQGKLDKVWLDLWVEV